MTKTLIKGTKVIGPSAQNETKCDSLMDFVQRGDSEKEGSMVDIDRLIDRLTE